MVSFTCVNTSKRCNLIPDVPEQNGDENVGGAELGQMSIWRHDLDHGFTPKVPVQVLGYHDRNGHVPVALDNVAGDLHVAQEGPHVTLEDGWATLRAMSGRMLKRVRLNSCTATDSMPHPRSEGRTHPPMTCS